MNKKLLLSMTFICYMPLALGYDQATFDFVIKNKRLPNLSEIGATTSKILSTDLSEASFEGLDLTKINLSGANLTKANFTKANLINANLSDTNLTESVFTESNLQNVDIKDAFRLHDFRYRKDVSFTSFNIDKRWLERNGYPFVNLRVDKKWLSYRGALNVESIKNAPKKDSIVWLHHNYNNTAPDRATLKDFVIKNKRVPSLNKDKKFLKKNSGCYPEKEVELTFILEKREACAKGFAKNLSYLSFEHTDLSKANLYGVDFSGSNLSGANLSEAILAEAIFFQANLSGANLSNAVLPKDGYAFYKANLSEADFSGAKIDRGLMPLLHTTTFAGKGIPLSKEMLKNMGALNVDSVKGIN